MTVELTEDDAARILAGFRAEALAAATDQEAAAVAERLETWVRKLRAAQWEPYPWQHPHVHPEGWVSERVPGKQVCDARCILLPEAVIPVHGAWTQRGGRGTGKTDGAAHYINAHAEGPACDTRVPGGHRFTIVAPTQPDAVSSCITGVSGVQAINPAVSITTGKEGTIVRWPNGAVGRLLGANSARDVDRARAWTNVCVWWLEEAAAQPQLAGMVAQAPFTMRLGARPHMVVTTTPRNRPEVKKLLAKPGPQTWGRTRDADRLDPAVREALETEFAGTTLGQQELDGDEIGDVTGALWVSDRPTIGPDGKPNPDERPGIENDRVPVDAIGWSALTRPETMGGDGSHDVIEPPADCDRAVSRVVISVDPPGGRTECGIIVNGSIGTHGYVLADLSGAYPPDTWARIVLEAYYDFGAEGLAVEHTYGGNMVPEVIGARAELLGIAAPPIFKVPTKVGKRLRAEPVQGLYQQHRIHHVGLHDGLEAEMRTWVPNETTESPNRIDALVHGMTYLLIKGRAGSVSNPAKQPMSTRMPTTFRGGLTRGR